LNNNFAYRDYFQYGKSGKTHVQIAFGVVTHKPGYYFSAPIKDGEVIVGVVVIKVETSYIDHILSSSSLESTGNYFLTDENGVVVSTNKKIEEYQSLGKIEESKLAKLRSERRFEGFGMKPLQYQVVQDVIDQYDGVEVIEYRDYEDGDEGEYEKELIQVKKIGEFPFYLVSESSLDSIVATIAKIVWPISGLMLIVVSLGLTIQYFVLRKTFAPLSKLEQYTQDVIDKPSLKVPEVKTGDEIESLATSIGQMVVRLSEAKIDLEAKIEEKTSELTKNILEMSEKNMAMSRNEIAMLNILEDSKELEKQLEEEKKSVEAKVERRTKELSEEQAKLMASISALPRAFLILDKDSNILIHNGRIGSIFDKSESDWSIEMINTLLGEQIDLPAKLKQVFDNNESFEISDLMFNAKYLRIYLAPVLTKDQVLLGAVMTIKDESEAKALARSRDEFFSIASHELRTPLTAIRGNTSMIMEYHKEVLKDQDLKEMIEDTHEASIRLIGIVNDFLDMSRLEQGKMEYKLEKVEYRNLIDKVMSELEGCAKEKGIEL
jgi:signal transduction histidine kinase